MNGMLKLINLSSTNSELTAVFKQQINLVRTKIADTIRFVDATNYKEESILLMKGHLETAANSYIPKTGNELLDQYYMEGMKLFCQGPFAENVGKNEDQLGVFL
jgi:hypothetical protein